MAIIKALVFLLVLSCIAASSTSKANTVPANGGVPPSNIKGVSRSGCHGTNDEYSGGYTPTTGCGYGGHIPPPGLIITDSGSGPILSSSPDSLTKSAMGILAVIIATTFALLLA